MTELGNPLKVLKNLGSETKKIRHGQETWNTHFLNIKP